MDTKLPDLTNKFKECSDKLATLNYVYSAYTPKYIHCSSLINYIKTKHTLIELKLMELETQIEEIYNELELTIIANYDKINLEIINELKRVNDEKLQNEKYNTAFRKALFYTKYLFACNEPGNYFNTPYMSLTDEMDGEITKMNEELQNLI